MAEQGPSSGFQHVEVPIHSLDNDTMLAALGLENQLTSPKTIEESKNPPVKIAKN
jgi:hypothetical protein